MSAKTDAVEYVEVSINEFGGEQKIPFDIFIRLSESHFVRIASQGDDLDPDRIARYKGHKILSLYLRREDFLKYAGLKLRKGKTGVTAEQEERQVADMCRMGDLTLEIIFFNEMNEVVYGTAREFVETTVALLTDSRHAAGILAPLSTSANFIYAHGVAVSAYSVMIARALGWTNTANIFRLATGALLHDIGKRDFPREMLLRPTERLTPEEVKALREHPVLGVRIMEKVQSVPTDILDIILQHHETAHGTGYPKHLNRLHMHPMSRIVAAANGFCNLVLRGPDGPGLPPLEAVRQMETSHDYDPETLAALKTLFKT